MLAKTLFRAGTLRPACRAAAILVTAAVTATSLPGSASAEPRGRWRGEIHRFQEHDFEHWRRGRWWHGWHEGREGWWWLAGGVWYWYPAPIYPYPDPYQPPGVLVPPGFQPSQVWYYCQSPAGYFPYVPACSVPWQAVPAAPQPPAPPPPAVPMGPPTGQAAPPNTGIDKAAGGTVLGAIGGGVAGAQFGHGSGNLAAVAAGSLLGAFLGHEVGASLDRADALAASQAEQTAYQAPIGQAIAWNNPGSNHSGSITPLRNGQDAGGNYCREFLQTVMVAGRTEQAYGTACRRPDGTWRVLGR
jgi:surface antigen